jgi:hypothetical protein
MKEITYDINKGVNKPIEFHGLKAQYIWYTAGGLALLLIAFAAMYLAEVPVYVSLPVVGLTGGGLVAGIYRYNHKYGEHGMMKALAYRQVPSAIICRTRTIFIQLSQRENGNSDDGAGGRNAGGGSFKG